MEELWVRMYKYVFVNYNTTVSGIITRWKQLAMTATLF